MSKRKANLLLNALSENRDPDPASLATKRVRNRKTKAQQEAEEKKGNATMCVFDPKKMIENFTMMIYGARRVGKTHVASYIISKIHERFKEVWLMSETIHLQPDAWTFIPEPNRLDHFDEELIMRIYKDQERKIDEVKRLLEPRKLHGDRLRDEVTRCVPAILLILDDIINDPAVAGSSVLSKLFISGRHLRISLMFLSQTPARGATICRLMRTNVDYCLCSEMDTQDDSETAASLYFAKNGLKEGIQRLAGLTDEKHKFAVAQVHIRGKRTLEDHTCSFMAPKKIPPFKLKCAEQSEGLLHIKNPSARKPGNRVGSVDQLAFASPRVMYCQL